MIRVDPEFHEYIRPLSDEERQQLEANLVADGCRDPLVVWNGVLVDGHNRFEICERLGLGYRTVSKDFANREAVFDWMDALQLGRRNLTPDDFRLHLGRRYNRLKGSASANLIQNTPKGQTGTSDGSTAEKLAKEHGVSERTVKRAGKFAEEVDANPDLKAAVAAGVPVAKVRPVPVEKRQPRPANALTYEALAEENEVLKSDLAEVNSRLAQVTAERDALKALVADLQPAGQGPAVSRLTKQVAGLKYKLANAEDAAKRAEFKEKKALARVKELEDTPVEVMS